MRKLLIILSAALAVAASAEAQDLNSVLKKHYEASKFADLEKVESMKIDGKTIVMGTELPMKMYRKRPGKFRLDGDFMGNKFTQVVNGDQGWQIAPWTGSNAPQAMPAAQVDQLKAQSGIEGPLYDYKAKGFDASYGGVTSFDGRNTYKVTLTKGADKINFFIDTNTNFLHGMTTATNVNGQDVEVKLVYSNYKMINGIPVSHTMDTYSGTQKVLSLIFNTVEFNPSVPDALFER